MSLAVRKESGYTIQQIYHGACGGSDSEKTKGRQTETDAWTDATGVPIVIQALGHPASRGARRLRA